MLDTGCKTTVGGEEWHEDMTQAVEARGKGYLIQEHDHEYYFRFGDGRAIRSDKVRIYEATTAR